MSFWIVISLIFIISFIWALLSLKKEFSKTKEIEDAKQKLKQEKILFKQ